MKAVVAAFNQEKALVGAFSVITNLRMDLFEALVGNPGFIVRAEEVSSSNGRSSGSRDNFPIFMCLLIVNF